MSAFTTFVIRLPEGQEAKRAIVDGLKDLVDTHGGEITGQSANDEMTLAEMFEKRLNDWEADEARKEAEALEQNA
jgi:hypothetical protein